MAITSEDVMMQVTATYKMLCQMCWKMIPVGFLEILDDACLQGVVMMVLVVVVVVMVVVVVVVVMVVVVVVVVLVVVVVMVVVMVVVVLVVVVVMVVVMMKMIPEQGLQPTCIVQVHVK